MIADDWASWVIMGSPTAQVPATLNVLRERVVTCVQMVRSEERKELGKAVAALLIEREREPEKGDSTPADGVFKDLAQET
jgi:hypothetical protein